MSETIKETAWQHIESDISSTDEASPGVSRDAGGRRS